MSSDSIVELTSYLPTTPYTLAYALPFLFISLVLTYAGAFLTLDRTRTFAPRYDAIEPLPGDLATKSPIFKRKKLHWLLEGGIGGLAIGYAFGVHCATFLSLLVPNDSSSSALGHKSFLAAWLISAVVTTLLAGRFKYAALTFSGIAGGATLSLALCILLHPSLTPRLILTGVLTPLFTLLTLLPIPRLPSLPRIFLRLTTSALGAFGFTLSIALLANVAPWANAWERLWVKNGTNGWGSGKEKGLSAGFWLFLISGVTVDWVLKRRFGENPDQRWDSYLANYVSSLPSASDRAGFFQPLQSRWAHLFSSSSPASKADDIIFPDTTSPTKPPLTPLPSYAPGPMGKLHKSRSNKDPESGFGLGFGASSDPAFEYQKRPGFLRKNTKTSTRSFAKYSTRSGRKREVVKFEPLADDEDGLMSSEDEDDEDDILKTPVSPPTTPKGFGQLKKQASASSQSTMVNSNSHCPSNRGLVLDYEKERERLRGIKASFAIGSKKGEADGPVEYSDCEEDVMAATDKRARERGTPGWSPEFIRKHQAESIAGSDSASSNSKGNSSSQRTAVNASLNHPSPPPGAVPMTPSLIRAIDRIGVAQREAYGAGDEQEHRGATSPRWDVFWQDVQEKAGLPHGGR